MADADPDLGRRMLEEGLLKRDDLLGALVPSAAGPAPMPARVGRYEILRLLGRGASAEVYLARDPSIGREVAIKVLSNPGAGGRFEREARILGSLRHPNIVAVFDSGAENGRPYFVMDRIDGRTLQAALGSGSLARRERVALLRDVALACHFAHESGVVHRDLKPANILIDATGRPFVSDFGIARPLDAQERMTLTGTTIGTPWYMSPEQAEGEGERLEARSDVFSLGVILYELLAGQVPFQGETFLKIAHQVIHQEPRDLRGLDPSIPSELQAVALKAMEKSPARRYPTAKAFADDLTAWLEGRPVTARRPSAPVRWARWLRRRPAAVVLTAAAAMAGLGLAFLQGRLAHDARELDAQRRVDEELGRIVAWDVELYKPPQQIGYTQLARSIAALEEIVRAGRAPAAAHYGIARARIRMGRADLAMDDLDRAIGGAAPKEAALYLFERARVVWEVLLRETLARDVRQAERLAARVRADLEAALEKGVEDAWVREFAGALLVVLQRKDPASLEKTIEACGRLREAKEKPAEEAWKLVGDLRLMTRAPAPAIDAYQEALRIRQGYVQAKTGLALAHLSRFSRGSDEERRRAAEEVLRHAAEAVEMNPAYGETYHLFSVVCWAALQQRSEAWGLSDPAFQALCRRAVEIFERGRKARPDFPPLETALGAIHAIRARALIQSRQPPEEPLGEALRAFDAVVRVDPSSPEGLVGVGLAHQLWGAWLIDSGKEGGDHLAQAEESLRRALRADPRSGDPHRWLGHVHYARREKGEAIEAWRRAIEMQPSYRDELERMIAKARAP